MAMRMLEGWTPANQDWTQEDWEGTHLCFGLLWASVCGVCAGFLLNYLCGNGVRRAAKQFDPSMIWAYSLVLVMECIGSMFHVINQVLWHSMMVRDLIGGFQLLEAGVKYVVLVFFIYQGRPFDVKLTWNICVGVGAVVSVIYATLAAFNEPSKSAVFLIFYEPIIFIRICCSLAMALHYTGYKGKLSLVFSMTKLVMLCTHVYTLFTELYEPMQYNWSYPMTQGINGIMELMATFCIFYMTKEGMFTAVPHRIEPAPPAPIFFGARSWVAKEDPTQKRIKTIETGTPAEGKPGWHTHYLFPERIFTYSVVPLFIAYIISGSCLFGNNQPNVDTEPIYQVYGSFHPTILLNYLPGSLLAMPLFLVFVLLQQAGVVLIFVRSILFGDVMGTVLFSAVGTVLFVVSNAIFMLVFPLASSKHSILSQAIPYMLQLAMTGFFLLINIWVTFSIGSRQKQIKLRHNKFYIVYMVVFLIVVAYNLSVMSDSLFKYSGWEHNSVNASASVAPLATMGPAARTARLDADAAKARASADAAAKAKAAQIAASSLNSTDYTQLKNGGSGSGVGHNWHTDLDFGPFLGAFLLPFGLLLYRFLSPLKNFPIAFEICSFEYGAHRRAHHDMPHNVNIPLRSIARRMYDREAASMPMLPSAATSSNVGSRQGYDGFGLSVSPRRLLLIALGWLYLTASVAYQVDKQFWTAETIQGWSSKDFLTAAPGSMVMAVGWVPTAACLLLYMALTVIHEARHNQSNGMTLTGVFLLMLMACVIFFAPTDTIPDAKSTTSTRWLSYEWWAGWKAFECCLPLWIAFELLAVSHSKGRSLAVPHAERMRINALDEQMTVEAELETASGTVFEQTDGCICLCKPEMFRDWITTMFAAESMIGFLVMILLVVSVITDNPRFCIAWMALLGLWALLDSRTIVFMFQHVRIGVRVDALTLYDFIKRDPFGIDADAPPVAKPGHDLPPAPYRRGNLSAYLKRTGVNLDSERGSSRGSSGISEAYMQPHPISDLQQRLQFEAAPHSQYSQQSSQQSHQSSQQSSQQSLQYQPSSISPTPLTSPPPYPGPADHYAPTQQHIMSPPAPASYGHGY